MTFCHEVHTANLPLQHLVYALRINEIKMNLESSDTFVLASTDERFEILMYT